ncbi:hypothetical protein [Chitinophaga flava]|uniref:hypothetical protein n=1 Tax=Chitinophaga flava TaxID=2259036 RepID=UPI0011BFC21D|nr:hypothetical protein [Chitinophaga flava]
MNKARVLLSAVALSAVIGAITSSKAMRPGDKVFITDEAGPCSKGIDGTLTTNPNFLFNTYASLVTVCPDRNDVYQAL